MRRQKREGYRRLYIIPFISSTTKTLSWLICTATMTTVSTTTTTATPLFDAFLDVPHPAASAGSPPVRVISSAKDAPVPPAALVQQVQQFAFFEYQGPHGTLTPAAAQQQRHNTPRPLNRFDQYAMQPKSFTSFTCTLQQADGTRVYGHVRRSLPAHEIAKGRYDVGRRGERAWIILTRMAGAELLFSAILKYVETTRLVLLLPLVCSLILRVVSPLLFYFILFERSIDAITALQMALDKELQPHPDPQTYFLHALTAEHDRLQQWYNSSKAQAGKPLVAVLPGLELGVSRSRAVYANVDAHRFLLPTSVLRKHDAVLSPPRSSSPILPLLRCVGVAHTLRILTALLSERRVIFCSASATRLSACSHAAMSLLQCGNLSWQHLYIPVLPPHLWDYLAAPYPYVIGILNQAWPKLEQRAHEMGQCLQIFLDTNSMAVLGADGKSSSEVNATFPDLFASVASSAATQVPSNQAGGMLPPSAAEFLAQDLLETLKTDKKTLHGEQPNAVLSNVGETAGKAAKAIKSGFSKLRTRVKGGFKSASSGSSNNGVEETLGPDDSAVAGDEGATTTSDTNAGDYIFTEGCHNEVAEEEVRLAFTAFFLSLMGDLRWFLSVPAQGQMPVLDRNRYKQLKGQTEPEGSPIHLVLHNFCQTQMLEEFAKQQVAQIHARHPITADSTLFDQCAAYHRQHKIDFGVQSLRQVSRQIAESNPGRLTGLVQTNARRMAMSLTSNKAFEGDQPKAISQLVEECRESSSVLLDVMSVVWLRLRDSRGMQWKHALLALQILKNLLYHGPLAAVAEATDGLDKIRSFRFYENMRQAAAQDVRNTASLVYNLLVDRPRLFSIRRVCAERRRQLEQGPMAPRATRKVSIGMPFGQMHATLHPMAQGTVARMPGSAPTAPPAPPADLFGLATSPPAGVPPPQQVPSQSPSSASDMVGLFDNLSVSSAPAPAAAAVNAFAAQPTIVNMPPKAPQPTAPSSGGVPAFAQPPTQTLPSSGGMPAFAQPPQSHQPLQQGYYQQQGAPPQHQHSQVAPTPQHYPAPPQQYPGQAPQPSFAAIPPQQQQMGNNPFGGPPPPQHQQQQGQSPSRLQNFDPFS